MAIIPIADFSGKVQGSVASINTSINERGSDAGALTKFGGDVSQIGTQLAEQRYKADTNDFVHSSLIDASIGVSDFARRDQMQNPDGIGHRDRVQEYLQQFQDKYTPNAPNEDAQTAFTQGLSKIGANSIINAQEWSDKTRAETYTANLFKDGQDLSNQQLTNPSINSMPQQLALIDARWNDAKNLNVDEKTAEKNKVAAKDDLAENFFNGLTDNKQSDMALKMLTNPSDQIANNLTADKRDHMIQKIQAKMKMDSETHMADVHDMVSNFMANPDPSVYQKIISNINNSSATPYQRQGLIEKMKLAVTAKGEEARLNNLTSAQLHDYTAPSLPGTFGTTKVRGDLQGQLQADAQKVLDARKDDINAYLASNDKEIQILQQQSKTLTNADPSPTNPSKTVTQDLIDLRNSKAIAIGEMPKVLDKYEASNIRESIVGAQNGAAAAKVVGALQQSMGKYVQGAFAQSFHSEADAAYGIMAYMPTDEAKAKVWQAIKDSKDTSKLINPGQYAALKTQTQNYMAHETYTLLGSGEQNAGVAAGLQQAVELNSKKYLDTGSNVTDAVQKSYKEIVADNFTYAEDNLGRGALVPKHVGNTTNTEDNISSFLNTYGSIEGLKTLDIKVDPKYKGVGEDGYINAINQHGKWVLSPNQLGMTLVLQGPNGLDVVYNKSGKLVQKSFDEISVLPKGNITKVKK